MHSILVRQRILVSLGIWAAGAATALAQIPDVPGWKIKVNEEFNGSSLNTSMWTAMNRRDSFNNEKQYYHPNQVVVADGNLQITAINVPRDGKAYQSGLITSNATYGPGRFEARMNLPTTQGMWPAFWLNANNVSWPKGGEIDILENRGSQPNLVSSAYHWQVSQTQPCCDGHQYVFKELTYSGPSEDNYHNAFHTYAVEWEETQLRFYVDGTLYHSVTENANRPIYETAKNIILNLAIGGDFGGDPNGSTVWPQTLLVDYVRIWQKQTGLAGDYNTDGIVDAADYSIWRDSQGQTGIDLPADGSGNGTVGPEDFDLWKTNYDGAPGVGAATSQNVPEPGTVPLTLGALLALLQRARLASNQPRR
ncbi:MAG: family 16 glycosylhydrolase [Pirellulales bacterium]